jgi:N-dimethylarginine dimethylaminohydrolase
MNQSLVMCSPDGFTVNYEINPWMKQQIGHVSSCLATEQWQYIFDQLTALATVCVMPASPDWPDLVFTANAGLPLPGEKKIILSNFRHPQRQGETAINRAWFEGQGWACIDLPTTTIFEGAGDALFDTEGRLWLGAGPRSNEMTMHSIAQYISTPIHRLSLVDPRFYHLDTCFCPLPGGYALYLPESFDEVAKNLLEHHFGSRLIALTETEGEKFCANAVCVNQTIFMNEATPRLRAVLDKLGFVIQEVPLAEFMKAGGSAKCLTLSLGEMGCD